MSNQRPAFSNLMKAIRAGKFVFSGELEPEKETNIDTLIKSANAMKKWVIAANVTDGPQSMAYACSLACSHLVQQQTGLEVVYQMTVRDRNRIGLVADVLGAAVLGIKNILALAGDHSALGDHGGAKPVFDLDSAQFVHLLSNMIDKGTDFSGREIHGKVEINVAVAANPNAVPREPEIIKVERKVKCGADFIQTQTAFDIDEAKSFLKDLEYLNCPVLLGIFPLKSYGIAKYFNDYIPGVSVPKEILAKMKATKQISNKEEKKAKIDQINVDFFEPFIAEIKKTTKAAGVHCMAVLYERLFEPLLSKFI
ncbi:MAG: methylenetetrahydrofolate reductase [Candidatus Helarchaeota archaeon]